MEFALHVPVVILAYIDRISGSASARVAALTACLNLRFCLGRDLSRLFVFRVEHC